MFQHINTDICQTDCQIQYRTVDARAKDIIHQRKHNRARCLLAGADSIWQILVCES